MAKIPSDTNFHHCLNSVVKNELPRNYLGLSSIGEPCYRKLQYYHYWAYKTPISVRLQRLFDFGHLMEPVLINELLKVNIVAISQQSEMTGTAGHWKGHCDSIGFIADKSEEKFLIEYKTHNDKSFKDLCKKKVKESKPVHFGQITSYMGYLKLPKCLYVAYNKNDSEIYTEWVDFDEDHFKELQRKEFEIIASDALLPRIGNNSPTWFECKMCDASKVCFGKEKPTVTCRSCKHVDVLDAGEWSCSNPAARGYRQEDACELYELSEMFVDG